MLNILQIPGNLILFVFKILHISLVIKVVKLHFFFVFKKLSNWAHTKSSLNYFSIFLQKKSIVVSNTKTPIKPLNN